MSDSIGTYTFLPWLRRGIANQLTAAPDAQRGEIAVRLTVSGSGLTNPADVTVAKTIALYGPGDIVGIDAKAIVKTEPRNWITNFEPNYLPYIDFYDEDFPWRYTPTAVSGDRLIPWLTLLVLTEDEFTDGSSRTQRPLNHITIPDTAVEVFPPQADLWAWAHVHVDQNIVGADNNPIANDIAAVIGQFETISNSNPDMAHSRLLSPRKLKADTSYHAFLIPTFETGRLAGLGIDPESVTTLTAESIAWAEYSGRQEPANYPYYYRWYFRTGAAGDFEYLVRLLKPARADSRVGYRDMDVLQPGANISGITDERLQGILRLGGALRVPTASLNEEQLAERRNYESWYDSYPHPFQSQLAAFINLADDYTRKPTLAAHNDSGLILAEDDNPDDPDPLLTPPLYGRWHALTPRLLQQTDGTPVANSQNWVHELNLDPRWRVAANFGTEVIQTHQEAYMDAAWEQVGAVLDANRRLRWSALAQFASKIWHRNNLQAKLTSAPERALLLTTPLHKRLLFGSQTVFKNLHSSRISRALLSAPMRRISRPRGRLAKRLRVDIALNPENIISRVNSGAITPAVPHKVPDSLLTHEAISNHTQASNVPTALLELLSRYPWLQYLPLLLGLLVILVIGLLALLGFSSLLSIAGVAAAAYAGFWYLRRLLRNQTTGILPTAQTPAAVDALPLSPDFQITEFGDPFIPSTGVTDSATATRFKTALQENYDFVQRSAAAGKPPEYTALDIPALVNTISTNLNPAVTIPRYVLGQINIPGRILEALQPETFVEAMAYPEIDLPMYKPLSELSGDHFVPNLERIAQNSITLLETNQQFIEAYMVGLNHEFSRELLWREYPTDQRGSYFRQFWEVASYLDKAGLEPAALREQLRDIPPLHRWSRRSRLGDHDQRELNGEKAEETVLVIRGELLKKYPTAVIYAHRARWAEDAAGNRILSAPREFATGELQEIIKTPLYDAKVDPDIYFFGFDLTVTEARGDSGTEPADQAGWFFVIKERPGEPRFGLDVPGDATDSTVSQLQGWDQLAWSHILTEDSPEQFIHIDSTRSIRVVPPSSSEVAARQQQLEDSHIIWSRDMNAAELAYILYQVPVLIGVHASEMLPKES